MRYRVQRYCKFTKSCPDGKAAIANLILRGSLGELIRHNCFYVAYLSMQRPIICQWWLFQFILRTQCRSCWLWRTHTLSDRYTYIYTNDTYVHTHMHNIIYKAILWTKEVEVRQEKTVLTSAFSKMPQNGRYTRCSQAVLWSITIFLMYIKMTTIFFKYI